jgi:hypothetical protein
MPPAAFTAQVSTVPSSLAPSLALRPFPVPLAPVPAFSPTAYPAPAPTAEPARVPVLTLTFSTFPTIVSEAPPAPAPALVLVNTTAHEPVALASPGLTPWKLPSGAIPFHTTCPAPLAQPRAFAERIPSVTDPPLVRAHTPPGFVSPPRYGLHLPCHIAIQIQVKSVRPESSDRISMDWFRASPKLIRRQGPDDPFSYRWGAAHSSWCLPPAEAVAAAAAKWLRDYAVGVFVAPSSSASNPWFAALKGAAASLFHTEATPSYPALSIFVIDSYTSPHTSAPCTSILLSFPHDWGHLFQPKPSALIAERWEEALSLFPLDDVTIRVSRCIRHGASYSFLGDRFLSYDCPIPAEWFLYEPQLVAARETELLAGWRSGVFSRPPFFNFRSSPVKGAEKFFSKKIRHVNHQSYPYDGSSVNASIVKGELRLVTFPYASRLLSFLGTGTLMFSFDVKAAYKQVELALEDLHLNGELTPEGYSFSTRPCFGCRQSGFIWEDIGQALEFIIRHHSHPEGFEDALLFLIRYVDDFLCFVPPMTSVTLQLQFAARWIARIKHICSTLAIEIGKWTAPAPKLVWLGLGLDGDEMRSFIPIKRLTFLIDECTAWSTRTGSCSKKELQSLHGHLQFAANVIRCGRFFTGRIIKAIHATAGSIVLNDGIRADIAWWVKFLPIFPGFSLLRGVSWPLSECSFLSTDACKWGGGAAYMGRWISWKWPSDVFARAFRVKSENLAFLELQAIVQACATWAHLWSRRRITLYTDSLVCVTCFDNHYASDPHMQRLYRILYMICDLYHFDLRLVHLTSKENRKADLLSRNAIRTFLQEYPSSAPSPDTVVSLSTLIFS